MDAVLTLTLFFQRYFSPLFLSDARPRTFRAYHETLAHWVRLVGNPPLCAVTSLTLAEFKTRLQASVAAATVNKHLRHLNAMLAKAGPAGPGNRDALGLSTSTPWTRPLREVRRLPRAVSDAILGAIYGHADRAMWPHLGWTTAGAWWRAIISLAVTADFRRAALLGLTWSDVDVGRRTVHVPAAIDKCHAEREKPLHAIAVRHLLAIRGPEARVFPFDGCEQTWYRTWHGIQDAADIPRLEQIKFHDLKRYAGTRYASSSSPWVVQQMLDHSSIETSRYYINATEACRAAVDAFPLPPCFDEEEGG